MERERAATGRSLVEATLGRMRWGAVFPLAAALALGIGTLQILDLIARPLALLILAITLAEALSPIVGWLEARLNHRTGAVVLVYLVLALVVGGLGWIVAPMLLDQARELGRRAPALIENLRQQLSSAGPLSSRDISGFMDSLSSRVGDLIIAIPSVLFQGILDTVLVVFLSIYWLITSRSIRHFTLSLLPQSRRARAGQVLSHMGRSMGGYVRGAAINAVIMGVLAYVGLLLIGVSYPLVLGVLTMMGEVVPIIGPVVVGAIVTAIALLQSLTRALMALGLFVLLEQVEGHLLTPNIMRSQTDVPQTLVLFAIVVGAAVGGILGIFVSIPLAAAFRVLIVEVLVPAEQHAMGGPPTNPMSAEE